MKNPNADEDLDEEDYEENAVVQGETVCRVLILVLLDNTSFPTIIDENLDCLAQFRKISNQTCSLLVNGEYKFSYLFNEKLEVFSTDSESLPIKNLIETYHIKHLVVDEKIKFHLFQEDLKVSEQVPDPDELFREPIKIKYLASQTHIDKIIVGKVFPKPELLIVSHSGDEESSFKYKDFLFSEVNENAVNFVSKSGMQALELCFEFKTGEKRRVFMEILNLILNKDKQIEGGKGMSRHYLVKKINRYGVKQKRLTWFDFADSTFNISTVENKGTKQFAIKKIMHFMKKANNCIVVEFYKEVNAKKLSLVFSNEEELNECMELAQRMQRALRESKFQSKQSVIFKEVVLQNKEGRKFTWLAKNVTEATSTKNQEHQFYYNVLQVGIISHEKRYLVLDYFTKEIMFLNNRNKVLRTMKIANFTIKYYMQNPLKIMITSVKSSIELIFPSVYIKFHFASNCYMIKSPEKVFPSSAIMKTPIKVYTSSWNIGQKAEPTPETLQIFLSSSENHQIIALGFQECKLNKFNLWLKALTSYYSEREKVLLSYISMWGMFLVVYIEKSLLSNVTDIVTLKKATGVANIIGNKGGVLMSFRLEDTSFCFLSCHLAARFNRLLLRNQNAKDLLNLRPSVENLEFSVEFDYTFWIGDFNYRIEEDFYKAIQMIGDQQFEVLWPNDQMLQQVSSNQMYATFREGILKFKPTYRLIPSHDEWSNKREQTPSWTDRIIFKSHNPIEIHEYSNIDNCYGSDHRPIFASFTTEVRNWYVPENLSMLSDDNKFGVLELQNLSINYTEETFLTHAMLTFHSAHLESEPKSSQVPLTSEKTIVFLGETLPILFFIFPNPDILKDLRFTIILNLLNIEGAKETAGYASIPIRKVVEFIQKNYEVDYRISFNTNLSALLEVDLEINSKIVGKVQGAWTFNICSRSEQYRF